MYRFMMPGCDLQRFIGPTVRPKITKSIRIICVTVNFMLTSHELSSYHPYTCSAPSITATSTCQPCQSPSLKPEISISS